MSGITEPDGMPVDCVPLAADVAAERTRCLAIIAREINRALRDIDETHAAPRLIVAVGRAEKAIARGDAADNQSNEQGANGAEDGVHG